MKTAGVFARIFVFAAVLFTLSLYSGCGKRLPGPDGNNPIARVAVLPMRNNTSHLYAPDWVRTAFHDAIATRYYSPIPLELVDQNLREKIGLSLGAQLDIDNPLPVTPAPQKVGEALGADGLIYSSLDDFSNFVTGVYNKYRIKARFKLVDARTGKIVWDRIEEVADSETNLSASKALKSAKGKIMEIAADHIKEVPRENPLPEPTATLIEKLINSPLPSGPIGAKR